MVKRYFGGIMSATPPTIGATAYGFWNQPAQAQAQKAGTWPILALPGMTAAYQTLINNFAGTKYYLSPTGNDTNNGTSKDTPLATYGRFYTLTSANTGNIMLIVLPGTYSLSSVNLFNSYGEVAISDNGYARQIVCAPGQVTFNWTPTIGLRDAAPFNLANASSNVYGCIFNRNTENRSETYAVAVFNNTTAAFTGKVYNVAIKETNTTGNGGKWSLNYANGSFPAGTAAYQCAFYSPLAPMSSYSGSGMDVVNCVSNTNLVGTTSVTLTNYLNAAGTMNSTNFSVSSATNQGVYYGTYAWPAP